eukprot:5310503-Amphidinium_carterae.1
MESFTSSELVASEHQGGPVICGSEQETEPTSHQSEIIVFCAGMGGRKGARPQKTGALEFKDVVTSTNKLRSSFTSPVGTPRSE